MSAGRSSRREFTADSLGNAPDCDGFLHASIMLVLHVFCKRRTIQRYDPTPGTSTPSAINNATTPMKLARSTGGRSSRAAHSEYAS